MLCQLLLRLLYLKFSMFYTCMKLICATFSLVLCCSTFSALPVIFAVFNKYHLVAILSYHCTDISPHCNTRSHFAFHFCHAMSSFSKIQATDTKAPQGRHNMVPSSFPSVPPFGNTVSLVYLLNCFIGLL